MIKHALLDLNMEISNYGQMYASSFLFWYDALRIIKMIPIVLMQLQPLISLSIYPLMLQVTGH
jgi:hypothetical protein